MDGWMGVKGGQRRVETGEAVGQEGAPAEEMPHHEGQQVRGEGWEVSGSGARAGEVGRSGARAGEAGRSGARAGRSVGQGEGWEVEAQESRQRRQTGRPVEDPQSL